MKKARYLAAIGAGLGALAVIILEARKRQESMPNVRGVAPYSHRDEQPHIVDEWGDESFPASDPPQSW